MARRTPVSWDVLVLLAECPDGLETADLASVLWPNDSAARQKIWQVLVRLERARCVRKVSGQTRTSARYPRGRRVSVWRLVPYSDRTPPATQIERWEQSSLFSSE